MSVFRVQPLPLGLALNESPSPTSDPNLHALVLQRVRDVPKEAAPAVIVDALEVCVANVPPRSRLPAAPGVVRNLLHWASTTAWAIMVGGRGFEGRCVRVVVCSVCLALPACVTGALRPGRIRCTCGGRTLLCTITPTL